MKTSENGIIFIRVLEELKLKSYLCPAGKWTIGWGTTNGITEGLIINEYIADILYRIDLEKYEECINKDVTRPLRQHQFDALVSLVYNIGRTAFRNSKLLIALNSYPYNKHSEIIEEWKTWRKVNKKIIQGLVDRRYNEIELFFNSDYRIEYDNKIDL